MPPQFALNLTATSSVTEAKLDEYTPADDKGVIVVKVSAIRLNGSGRPEEARVRVTLGKLKVGTYKLQLLLATKGEPGHTLLQTFELTAK